PEGIVIVGDFERREAVFAERAGDVAPGFAAFATSEFVMDGHKVASCRAKARPLQIASVPMEFLAFLSRSGSYGRGLPRPAARKRSFAPLTMTRAAITITRVTGDEKSIEEAGR